MSPTAIVAYVLLFAGTALVFVLAALAVGRLVRPKAPNPEKAAVYECGEPTIGPGFVQFDLRFYVVALVFLIFDVEAAFFFPWAAVFGSVTRGSDPALAAEAARDLAQAATRGPQGTTGPAQDPSPVLARLSGLGVPPSSLLGVPPSSLLGVPPSSLLGVPPASVQAPGGGPGHNLGHDPAAIAPRMASSCSRLASMALADIAVFFGVLLVGFAYVWKEGDLNWVRATSHGPAPPAHPTAESAIV